MSRPRPQESLSHAHVRFRRAIERRALWMAGDAARELPILPLEDALQRVHLYAKRAGPRGLPCPKNTQEAD